MADIVDIIRGKYNVDINTTNIFKLYKIDSAEISSEDLKKKIVDCRRKWEQSINGANEKFAERDRVHLEKADNYEKILLDKKFRKELFTYYNKDNGNEVALKFPKDYFTLVGSTTKIHKKEVEFFFQYFPEQRKNRKAIQEMLKKDFKVMGFGKDNSESDENEGELEGKKKTSSLLISNLFQEATIINLRKCENLYLKVCANENVCTRFPELKQSFYNFLKLEQMEGFADFKSYIGKQRTETANLKYDKGQEYAPLVDVFNNLFEILEYNDVTDNFKEFKLLIQYPKLTPYMYVFENMKQSTLKEFYSLASREYGFRDFTDFILTYFKPVYDNFGIYDQSIKNVFKDAEKKAGKKKVLDKIDKKFGLSKERKMTLGVKLVHALTYWPVYLLFAIFEITKFIVDNLRYISLVSFIPMLLFMLTKGSDFYGIKFSAIRGVVSPDIWFAFLDDFIGIKTGMTFEIILVSIEAIVLLLMMFIFPPIMGTVFLWRSASHLTKRYDWKGIERTLKMLCQDCRRKTEEKYVQEKSKFLMKRFPTIISNVVCLAIVILIFVFIPKGIHLLQGKVDYDFKTTNQQVADIGQDETTTNEVVYQVTVGAANVRTGPSKDYDVIATVNQGDMLIGTGKEEVATGGTTWYEIYLDDTHTSLGWASEKVISKINS